MKVIGVRPHRERIPPSLRDIVYGRSGGRCIRCGKEATQIHHEIQVKNGGTNDPSNLYPVCRRCHEKRFDPAAEKGLTVEEVIKGRRRMNG